MDFLTKGATRLHATEEGGEAHLGRGIGVHRIAYRDWIIGRLGTEEEQHDDAGDRHHLPC